MMRFEELLPIPIAFWSWNWDIGWVFSIMENNGKFSNDG
jgi:hypothetical protein